MPNSDSSIDRRHFLGGALATSASAGFGSAWLSGEESQSTKVARELACKVVTNDGGEILDVAQNREILQEIDRAKPLNPHQLLQIAGKLTANRSQIDLANRLFRRAIVSLAADSRVREAMMAINNRQMNWSIWGDIWNAVVDVATKIDEAIFGSPPDSRCDTRCAFVLLVERCPGHKNWTVIGICLFG
jgi:hypothetical protein